MSEELESTQPNHPADPDSTKQMKPYKEDDTQPRKPLQVPSQQPAPEEPQIVQSSKKLPRWQSTLIGIFGFLFLIGLGGFGGYNSGVGARENAENAILATQLSEQFSFALVDLEFGRYENARQRLEYIIQRDPGFPGAQEKLTEVLVLSSIPTPTAAPTATSTPDFSGAESAYARAQELTRLQDWVGTLSALDSIRKLDPTYKTAQVDGMYYFALRNLGNDLITRVGNLEGGIYYITLAERFGPLDNNSRGLRDGARTYMVGASFWELDWEQAANYFEQVAAGWPSMWDGTQTAGQRYFIASVRFADDLYIAQDFCAAYDQYQKAAAIGLLDGTAAAQSAQAFTNCFPATEAPTEVPTILVPTDAPTDVPTEVPTEEPTPDP
jgi:tetratricopeptide (TPR) repeat protein